MSQLLRGGGCWISSAGVSWEGFQLSLTCHLLFGEVASFLCASAALPARGAGLPREGLEVSRGKSKAGIYSHTRGGQMAAGLLRAFSRGSRSGMTAWDGGMLAAWDGDSVGWMLTAVLGHGS